ncbi:hypothetical protein ACFQZ4_37855 [Catellatospora coxensis]|uniref:Uncharacterized protein n=1 Tax=Catellatospora coxensis TaxID=310354 RepID=A0A8J3P4C2_9ACTN|nr:hypothetical protein [Catellatospora coxensis]GIG03663.1 hypothetical protein Cco03nite_03630 [Catellatospora coxensis]
MSTVLAELGKKYAERWVSLLVLPGLLFVAAVFAATALGHTLDFGRLTTTVERMAASVSQQPGTLAVVVIVVPVLSAAAGLAAAAVAKLVSRLSFEPWPAALLVNRRVRRWKAAADEFDAVRDDTAAASAPDYQARLDSLAAKRNAISLGPPERATWMGDRLRSVSTRVWSWYRLDLEFAWPRLWLLLDGDEQESVRAARAQLDSAVMLAGWGALYAALAIWSWPAALIGVALAAVAQRQSRAAVDNLAHLIEGSFDLHATDLARALGFEVAPGTLSPIVGAEVTAHLRKNV